MIKYPTRILLLFMLFCLFAACATRNITRNRGLADNEGILIAKIHTNLSPTSVLIRESNYVNYYHAELYLRRELEELKVIPIISGSNYHFGGLLYDNGVGSFRSESGYFDIEPGTITYAGDLYINWIGKGRAVQMKIIDDEEASIGEAREKYPWIFKKYPYRKHVPTVKIESVEGFEEVEELKKLKEEK